RSRWRSAPACSPGCCRRGAPARFDPRFSSSRRSASREEPRMEIRPILSALLRSETGAVLVGAQVALTLAIISNALFVVQARLAMAELGQANRELAGVRATERRRRSELAERFELCGLVFADPATEQVVSLACQVARADLPVLIAGPNGAGKE